MTFLRLPVDNTKSTPHGKGRYKRDVRLYTLILADMDVLLESVAAWAGGALARQCTIPLCGLVGVRGLEPPTSASRTLRASRLRYTPR